MPRVPAAAACLLLAGCGLMPTPRTDAALAAIAAPKAPLTAEEKTERKERRKARREDEARRKQQRSREADRAAYTAHLKENARRRRNGLENLPYKAHKTECEDEGSDLAGELVGGIVQAAFEPVADAAALKARNSPAGHAFLAALVTPFTLTADVVEGSAKAAHKTMLGMSSNEYRSRHDDWHSAGAFD